MLPALTQLSRGLRPLAFLAGCLALLAVAGCDTYSLHKSHPATTSQGAKPWGGAPTMIIDRDALTLPHMGADGQEPVRVGMLVPLSGPQAPLGKALLDAAQLAIFEAGRSDLLLIPEDTHGTPAGASAAMQTVIHKGAEIVLGPVLADEVTAVTPIAQGTHTPVVAFSTNSAVAAPGVYLLSFPPELEVNRVVDFAVTSGYHSLAALIPETQYGQVVESAFVSAVQARGATLGPVDHYPNDTSQMFDPAKRVVDQGGFDAILLPEGGTNLRGLAPLMPYYGVDTHLVKLLGTGLWDEPNVGREAALVGGWFAAPAPEARAAFVQRYTTVYGSAPLRLASLGYDGVALAAALSSAPPGQRFTPENITNPNGFGGIDGIFRFLPNGRIERGLAVNEVTATGFSVVSPAPASFTGGY